MITNLYDLDTVEEAFDIALRIDLTFKMLVNAKTQCPKSEEYGHISVFLRESTCYNHAY